MIEGERFVAFLAAAAVLAAVPGPGMLYVAARTLGAGRRQGLHATFGTAIGGGFHVVAAALGVSALLATSAVAFTVVKYAGAAYLIGLGIRTLLRLRHHDAGTLTSPAEVPPVAAVRQGALTEMLNPKTALFFLAFIPQFVDPAAGPVLVQMIVLGVIVVLLNSAADVVAVALAGSLHRGLSRRGTGLPRWPSVASGTGLVALGGYAALEK